MPLKKFIKSTKKRPKRSLPHYLYKRVFTGDLDEVIPKQIWNCFSCLEWDWDKTICRFVVESESKCVHFFCELVDYGGLTSPTVRSPQAHKKGTRLWLRLYYYGDRLHWRGRGHLLPKGTRRWCRIPWLQVRPLPTEFSHWLWAHGSRAAN